MPQTAQIISTHKVLGLGDIDVEVVQIPHELKEQLVLQALRESPKTIRQIREYIRRRGLVVGEGMIKKIIREKIREGKIVFNRSMRRYTLTV